MKEVLEDERKRPWVVLWCVTVLLVSGLLTVIILTDKHEIKKEEKETTLVSTKSKDRFKGYKTITIDYDKNIYYDYEKRYEFIYASGEDSKIIYTSVDDNELYYELKLDNGNIVFKEQKYKSDKNAYIYTGKTYTSNNEVAFTDYIVAQSAVLDNYAILALDKNKNVYCFKSPTGEFGIDYIINNLVKQKTITKVKKIGYYNYSNDPLKGSIYELVYLDETDAVRTFEKKNPLFFNKAYYRYVGNSEDINFIYVLKDGKMIIEGNNNYVYDGSYPLKYRGSFYTYNDHENIYLINREGYLFILEDFTVGTKNLVTRYKNVKIKRIGSKTIKDKDDFATSKDKILIEFEDGEYLEIDNAYEFEVLN